MAGAGRSKSRRISAPSRSAADHNQAEFDDALRAIVRALARQAAREVFDRESRFEARRDEIEDTP
jgi:hypothetical protein